MLLRPFLILLLIQQGSALETQNSTTLYNSEGSINCTSDLTISWLDQNGNVISSDNNDYSIAGTSGISTLTITSVTQTTTFTCSDSSGDLPVTIHVANIAGISSPLCKERCEVSCTLDLLRKDVATTVQWSGIDGVGVFYLEEEEVRTVGDGTTILKHRTDEFSFTSQQTFLTIKNLAETSHFTCMYTLTGEGVTLQYTVSALIRNTQMCDEYECTNKAKCHSMEISGSDSECRAQCTECFKYNYILGDFIDNTNSKGQCKDDKDWCQAILDNKMNCNNKTDPVVAYCVQCGYCLDLEFSASKMILPAIILLMLCLLTLLMCYKSYDEKRSVLPKLVASTTRTAAAGTVFTNSSNKTVNRLSVIAEVELRRTSTTSNS